MNHPADAAAGRRTISANALLARLGIRADRPSAELAARIIDALTREFAEAAPKLCHDDAAAIGLRLARQWVLLVGAGGPPCDDLVWADLVQFVLRQAREIADARGGGRP